MQTKFAIFRLILSAVLFGIGLLGSVTANADPPSAMRSLRTLDGREFFDVRVQKADPTGLFFQHRHGSAKISFTHLDPEIGKSYGYGEEEAKAFEKDRPHTEIETNAPAWADPIDVSQTLPPLRLTFRTRTIFPVGSTFSHGGCGYSPTGCGASLASYPWPSHWSRFHPGLAYSLFPCRQLAERDFLITSGILPRPPGVCTWRLR